MTAVAQLPWALDKGPLERARRPLAVITAVLLAVDLIALGLHLADSVENPLAEDAPTQAKTRVEAPDAVVPSTDAARGGGQRTAAATPTSPIGPVGPDPSPAPGGGPSAPQPKPAPSPEQVPVVQANVGVPALGTQVSLGVGDGGCTSLGLTVLSVGDCPQVSGDGPVVLQVGGSLLGD